MAFEVGAIVGKLQLKKDQWDQSIRKVKDDQKSLSGLVVRNSQQFKQMGRAMTIAGGAIVGAVGLMVKAYAGFDKSMTESLAIMGDISDEIRKEMAATALEMSTKTTFAAKELAKAYFFLASAGMDAAQSIKALPVVAKFAQAGAFDLAVATDLLTDAQTAMGLSSKNAIENQENLIKVSDILVKANTLANASVLQFSESLTNRAAAALVNVNKSMEEGVAVLAAFADKGVKGQIAGQRLAMMLNALDVAARKNKKAWDENGLALFDAQGEMRKTGDIIGDLEVLFADMTTEQKSATLAALGFNVRTKTSILTLMGSSEKIKQWEKDLKSAGGTTEEVAEKQLQTLNNQFILLKNTITKAVISIGGTLAPAIQKIVIDFKNIIGKVSEWIKEHPKLTEIIAKSALAVGGLLAVLGPLMMMLPGLVIILPKIGAAFSALLGPLGLVIIGIAAVGAGINKLINIHKKKLDEEMDMMIKASKGAAEFHAFRRELIDREIVTVKEWGAIYEKHGRNYKRVMKAISTLDEYAHIRKQLERIQEEEKKTGKTTEDLGKKFSPGLTKSMIDAVYKSDKLVLSLEDIGGVIKELPPDMSKFGQTSKDVFDSLIPGFGKVKEVTQSVGKEFGLLPITFFDSGKKILTTNDAIRAGIIKTGEEIGDSWAEMNKNIQAEWISTISKLITEFDSFDKIIKDTFNAIFKMFADTVAKMVTEWITGTITMKLAIEGIKKTMKTFAVAFMAYVSVGIVKHILTVFGILGDEIDEITRRVNEGTKEVIRRTDYWAEAIEELTKKVIAFGKKTEFTRVDQDILNKSWEKTIALAKEYGTEGSKAFVGAILKMRELGLEVKSLSEYIVNQLDKIPDALTSLIGSFDEVGGSIEDTGILALHTFNAMIESGMSWTETVSKMKEPLAALRDKYEELGMEADTALDELFKIIGVTEEHEKLFTAIDANKTILEALGNSGWLTQDALQALAGDAEQFYQNLIDAGIEGDTALRMMGPTLQKIQDYAEAYNLTLDEGTQALIDQATEIGVIKEAQEDSAETQEKLFKELGDTIEDAIKEGFKKAFDYAKEGAQDAAVNIGDTLSRIRPLIDIGFDYKMPQFNIPAFQHGGVIEAGPRQPTMLTFGEGAQRERAVISHIGGGETGAGDIRIEANFNVEALTVRSDEDVERIEEAFRRNVDGLSEKVAGHLRRFG